MEYKIVFTYGVVDEMMITASSVDDAIKKFKEYRDVHPKDFGRHISGKRNFNFGEVIEVSKIST
jgi:hypothetical protein